MRRFTKKRAAPSWICALLFIGLALLLAGASPVTTRGGLVVSAHPYASAAGAEILAKGGNAMDAAVATAYALAVVEPYSAGIGGGGFLVYREAQSGHSFVVDYREVAPRRAHKDMYKVDGKVAPNLSLEGALAVAVPGMVLGLDAAQKRFGTKKLRDVLDPAIDLARHGFRIDPRFYADADASTTLLSKNAEAKRVFLKNGRPYRVGEWFVQPDLARTLSLLKQSGPDLFRRGTMAKAIVSEIKRLGGIIELADLEHFKPRFLDPLIGNYRGHEIITMPPPSSGGTHLLQMLMLLQIDSETRGRHNDWRDFDDLAAVIESMRLAYADRATHMGDPAFIDVPFRQLLSREYLEARYRLIDVKRARPAAQISAGVPPPKQEPGHTTHLCVIDAMGNAVSLTQTINYAFGSGVVVPKTGILLNNEMDDFSSSPNTPNVYGLVGGEANSIAPGKIPLSSMTPTIVTKDGKVRLIVGAPGGSTIITTVLQVILHVVDHKMGVARAVAQPRLHHQWTPDLLRLEPGAVDRATRRALKAKGYPIRTFHAGWGNATAIEVLADGSRVGAADPRGVGAAVAQE